MAWAPLFVKISLCLFVVLIHMQRPKACLEKERLGLLEMKNFYRCCGYYFLSSWVDHPGANCCGWERVRCNHSTGRVTHLNFSGLLPGDDSMHAYHDTMNFSLLHPFEQLNFLDLSDNYFKNSVGIEGLCELKNLQELDISHNVIVRLPECMSNLKSLRVLDLSSTSMTGNVPYFITNLESLEYLSFFDTKLEGNFSFSALANHSKLEVFRLSTTADNLYVETESQPWHPTFHLKALQLANCNLNSQKGSDVPSFLLHQCELRLIDLSHNKLEGEFPVWLLNNHSKLETLKLKNNSFTGSLRLPISIHGLLNLGISTNKFGGQLPEDIGNIFPNISYLNIAKNNFVGSLPSSMVEMQRVQILDLSYNKFSGEFASHYFSNWTSLVLLSLSNNSFSGKVMEGFTNSSSLKFLFLNSNFFSGEIGDAVLNKSSLLVIDISSNLLSGRIPRWIGDLASIQLLSMSKNLFEGVIPTEICSLSSITYLDLSENNLSGAMPFCLGDLSKLEFLHMQKNNLTGTIPYLQGLYSLDLRDNKFYGEIYHMVPGQFDYLGTNPRVLLLGGNHFIGNIPDILCSLTELRIMDLSRNSLTGIIPSCLLRNMPTVPQPLDKCQTLAFRGPCIGKARRVESIWSVHENTVIPYNSTLTLNYNSLDDFYVISEPLPAEFRTKHNMYSYTGNVLELMSGLDLSCNELNGSIPPELGLEESIITALNLSHNHLTGTIPQSFSNLVKLESLDLSYNNLSGAIPFNLAKLNSLAIFNVSYNKLSGPTPTTGQFANFDMDNYRGNPGLYGPFLNSNSNRSLSLPPSSSEIPSNEGRENHTAVELVCFYWGSVSSFVGVVLGLAITLWFSPRWCRVWFRFVDLCIYYCFPCYFRSGFC